MPLASYQQLRTVGALFTERRQYIPICTTNIKDFVHKRIEGYLHRGVYLKQNMCNGIGFPGPSHIYAHRNQMWEQRTFRGTETVFFVFATLMQLREDEYHLGIPHSLK